MLREFGGDEWFCLDRTSLGREGKGGYPSLVKYINRGAARLPGFSGADPIRQQNCDRLSRPAKVVCFETSWAGWRTYRRHRIASAHSIWPSKPSVLAMSR
jgi:hypothetical protein